MTHIRYHCNKNLLLTAAALGVTMHLVTTFNKGEGMFKVGDEVKVVGNKSGHCLTIGNFYSVSGIAYVDDEGYGWTGGQKIPVYEIKTRMAGEQHLYAEDLELAGEGMEEYKAEDKAETFKSIFSQYKPDSDNPLITSSRSTLSQDPVQRYNFKVATVEMKSFGSTEVVIPIKSVRGEYVLFSDYEKLKQELDKLTKTA